MGCGYNDDIPNCYFTLQVIMKTPLEYAIETLEDAIKVCQKADCLAVYGEDRDLTRTYPYATGYSKSAMREALARLQQLSVDKP